jgi:hypothetical protein
MASDRSPDAPAPKPIPLRVVRRRGGMFSAPTQPGRNYVVRVRPGVRIIVGEDGYDVFQHPDPLVRLYNFHEAAPWPVYRHALVYAYRTLREVAQTLPYVKWAADLCAEALSEGVPKLRELRQAQSEEKGPRAA